MTIAKRTGLLLLSLVIAISGYMVFSSMEPVQSHSGGLDAYGAVTMPLLDQLRELRNGIRRVPLPPRHCSLPPLQPKASPPRSQIVARSARGWLTSSVGSWGT